jgi:hypothetical protein
VRDQIQGDGGLLVGGQEWVLERGWEGREILVLFWFYKETFTIRLHARSTFDKIPYIWIPFSYPKGKRH